MKTNHNYLKSLVSKYKIKQKRFSSLVEAVSYTKTFLPKVDTKSYISLPKIRIT